MTKEEDGEVLSPILEPSTVTKTVRVDGSSFQLMENSCNIGNNASTDIGLTKDNFSTSDSITKTTKSGQKMSLPVNLNLVSPVLRSVLRVVSIYVRLLFTPSVNLVIYFRVALASILLN